MSSAVKMQPPQTYSRLFRPWDSHRNANSHYKAPTSNNNYDMATSCGEEMRARQEFCRNVPATTSLDLVKHASRPSRTTVVRNHLESERSSSSSSISSIGSSSISNSGSSSSKLSSEEAMMTDCHPHAKVEMLPFPEQSNVPIISAATPNFYDSTAKMSLEHQHYQQHLQQQQTQLSMLAGLPPSPSELYYAAAAAAAANGITTPAAANLPPFGMDTYALGLMEQEYARVMAEDAQLKALNARKQRPKKFKCPHCDVAFSNNGQLKGHIRIHTGERPFKCDVETCGKTFTRNEELTRHKRIHTGLRPYPCTACGKKFGRRDHLKKHMKTHIPQERQLGPAIFVPMYPYLYGY